MHVGDLVKAFEHRNSTHSWKTQPKIEVFDVVNPFPAAAHQKEGHLLHVFLNSKD